MSRFSLDGKLYLQIDHGAMALVAEFAAYAGRLGDLDDLAARFAGTVAELGFTHHALAEHADPVRQSNDCLFVHNYPQAWTRMFCDRAMHRVDPVRQVASGRVGGFGWGELPDLISLAPGQMDMMLQARATGLGDGYTVPLHAPGSCGASCSFVCAPGEGLPMGALAAAEWLAHIVFATAHRLRGAGPAPARLTRRQRQCVALVAEGKTDWEIGHILGLSEETVGKYVDAARRRLGVARRTQLVVAALRRGDIGWPRLG